MDSPVKESTFGARTGGTGSEGEVTAEQGLSVLSAVDVLTRRQHYLRPEVCLILPVFVWAEEARKYTHTHTQGMERKFSENSTRSKSGLNVTYLNIQPDTKGF